jgi:hypothetical protein
MPSLKVHVVSSATRTTSSSSSNMHVPTSKTAFSSHRSSDRSRKAATATAAAILNIHADDSIGTISSQSTPEPIAPFADKNGLISQTVKDLSEVAQESYAGLKQWASSPSSKPNATTSTSTEEKQQEQEQAWYQMIVDSHPDLDKDATKRALQDLMSPFMVCHNASHDVAFDNDDIDCHANGDDGIADATAPSNNNHYYQNAIRTNSGRLQENLASLKERVLTLHRVDSDTVLSMDTAQEDEMMQLQRLSSWGTNGTNNSNSSDSVLSLATHETQKQVDDDGHLIPQVLLATAQKRRQARRRKRVVRFDYPPISSLRECPRPDPNDLPDLFFTEEELDEIEADRTSTITADDIEIVAVGSTRSTASSDYDYDCHNATSPNRNTVDGVNKFGSSSATTKLQRKPRSSSPHPARPAKGSWDGSASTKSKADPRLIKGVQIYLRERSTGKASRS